MKSEKEKFDEVRKKLEEFADRFDYEITETKDMVSINPPAWSGCPKIKLEMDDMTIDEIKENARTDLNKRGRTLTCDMFQHTVDIHHQDGSHFLLQNVIVVQTKYGSCDILLVWTEHCGYFYFFVEDLESWRKYTIVHDGRP